VTLKWVPRQDYIQRREDQPWFKYAVCTHAADVVVKSWTAAKETESDESEAQYLHANYLDSRDTECAEIHPERVLDQTCHHRRGKMSMPPKINCNDLQNRCLGQECGWAVIGSE
jgi:hypothetical protein